MRKFRETISRKQVSLLPASVEDYVSAEDGVRYVDTVIDELDIGEIESKYSEDGRPAYSPRRLVKLLVYGKLKGIRTGRELSIAAKENLRFIFLLNGERPDFRTINSCCSAISILHVKAISSAPQTPGGFTWYLEHLKVLTHFLTNFLYNVLR